MHNASEHYLLSKTSSDHRSPGQWLNLRETKRFMKEQSIKKPKKNESGEYMFTEKLFDAYKEHFLKESIQSAEENDSEIKLSDIMIERFGQENSYYSFNIFFQKVFGNTIPFLFKSTGLKFDDLIENSEDVVKLIYFALSSQLIALGTTERIITKTWIETKTNEILNNLIASGIRNINQVLYQNDKVRVTYRVIKEK